MALIRSADSQERARGAVVLDLGDIARHAEAARASAREQAAAIIEAAKKERERLVESARREGLERGLAEGREEGLKKGRDEGKAQAVAEYRQKLEALGKSWGEALASFCGQREGLLAEARRDVLRLALVIAEKIVRRKVAADPAAAAAQAEAALALLSRPTSVRVCVHPDDAGLMSEVLPQAAARLAPKSHVELCADPSVERGGCVLRTGAGGEVDATLSAQLGRVMDALLPGERAGHEDHGGEAANPEREH